MELELNSLDWNKNELEQELELEDMKRTIAFQLTFQWKSILLPTCQSIKICIDKPWIICQHIWRRTKFPLYHNSSVGYVAKRKSDGLNFFSHINVENSITKVTFLSPFLVCYFAFDDICKPTWLVSSSWDGNEDSFCNILEKYPSLQSFSEILEP